MFLMFALRRENVMPVGDLGIRMAIKKAYRKRKLPQPKDMLKLARNWSPYCTLACYYLWRSLDIEN
jgi:DNA-3-methyladenine glycosylase II